MVSIEEISIIARHEIQDRKQNTNTNRLFSLCLVLTETKQLSANNSSIPTFLFEVLKTGYWMRSDHAKRRNQVINIIEKEQNFTETNFESGISRTNAWKWIFKLSFHIKIILHFWRGVSIGAELKNYVMATIPSLDSAKEQILLTGG